MNAAVPVTYIAIVRILKYVKVAATKMTRKSHAIAGANFLLEHNK